MMPQCSYAALPITKETRDGFDYYNTSVSIYEISPLKKKSFFYVYLCMGKRVPFIVISFLFGVKIVSLGCKSE